jgi:cyclopropane fatty-acyl-phospholipid synthase-like methyltransferase
VRDYYDMKLREHGPTPAGVDWNSPESQTLRFRQLLKICDSSSPFSINDYGCGYGALVDYMISQAYEFSYTGFDLSNQMIAEARKIHQGIDSCRFVSDESLMKQADYTIASGIFNVKQQFAEKEWESYVFDTIRKITLLSRRGFAFNVLTKYSNPERMRPDLYYADPLSLFDYCKRNFSKFVALLHDYPLYEFTILVRSE